MFETRINLDHDQRDLAAEHLNACLANTIFAQAAAKFAHWNVKGSGFHPAHLLFDQVAAFYEKSADVLGERITALGEIANGLLPDVTSASTVEYTATGSEKVSSHMKAMADMLGQVVNEYRDEAGSDWAKADLVSQNMLLELAQEGDKMLYFLEADLR